MQIKRFALGIILLVTLCHLPYLTPERYASCQAQTETPVPSQPQVIAPPPTQAPSAQQPTPEQVEVFRNLTPEQQKAAEAELGKTGGILTPEAVEALKARPEFKGLTPEDIRKGKELQEKGEKEPEKKEPEKKEPAVVEKKVIGEEPKMQSLFERARQVGGYQDISLSLSRFGYDFFQEAAVRVLTERKDVPVPLKYVVGPGDEVKILMWGRMNAQYNLTVDRDGKITIPQIGPIPVAGMTFEQMSTHLIKQAEQITGTNIDISMGSLKTIPVFILGDVKRPGSYTIGAFATITDALLITGGPTEIGSMRKIQLRRKDRLVTTFDLYDLLLKGDKSKDLILQAGDVVFVPVTGTLCGIAGNVKRPAIYELRDRFDLQHLFDLAGGVIPSAYTQQIQVERIVKNEKQIVVDIDDKHLDKAKQFILQDVDLVKVFSIVDMNVNVVYLHGNLKRPGKYEFKPGMRVKDLIRDTAELLPETYFEYALIKRLVPPGLETVVVPFNLGKLLIEKDPMHNIELQPQDNIYVFSKWFFKDRPFFIVKGEVRKPGHFDLADNFKVKDGILTAGDLTKEAYLKKGEIIRVDKDKQYQTLYFNVSKALADDPAENIPLQDEDQIVIHSLYEEKWKEIVSITGEVKNPNEFLLTEDMKVSDLFFKAGGQTRDTLLDEAEIYSTDWRTKEVTLQKINLKKALEGDPDHNVLLRDLDRLVAHSVWEKEYRKSVSVEGEVKKPGTYQYAEKMRVRDLVFTAGNLLESASLNEAEISSQVIQPDGSARLSHCQVNLGRALTGDPEHNIVLRPYDRLFIKRIPDWRLEKYVTVTGEIKYQGKYAIRKGETLSAVIERAGGYLKTAYLRGAYFTRERVRELQEKSLEEMTSRMERDLLSEGATQVSTALSQEEIAAKKVEIEQKQKFIETLRKMKATGRMTIRLADLKILKGSEYDFELEDGDTLNIPEKNSVVNVAGAVMTQSSHLYSSKLGYEDYIEATGGYAKYADKDNVFVMKVDGSARKISKKFITWNPFRSRWEMTAFGGEIRQIEPGDCIVVPEKIERIAWLREIRDITQVLMNIAVVAGVAVHLY